MARASDAVRIASPPQRHRWLIPAAVVVAVGLLVATLLGNNEPATPPEQIAALAGEPGQDIQGLAFQRFVTAAVNERQAALTALYEEEAGYDMLLFDSHERASERFDQWLTDNARWPEAQAINTYDEVERCFKARGSFYCFGLDRSRAMRSYTQAANDPDGLEALLLQRTARKHWYRAYPNG